MEEYFFPKPFNRAESINCTMQDTHNNFHVYLVVNIFFGFAFSMFSQGLGLYIFFYLLWEMKYAYDLKCEYNTQIVGERLVLILSGITAFIFGRIILKRDQMPYRIRYEDCCSYSSIWSTFTGMGDFEE